MKDIVSQNERARSALPNMLTFANLLAGFAAVIVALHGLEVGVVKLAKGNALMGDNNFGDLLVGRWGDSPWRYIRISIYMVVFGLFCDLLDGITARRLKAHSDFGKELDSLSDLITFGVAPAVIAAITLRLAGENSPIPWKLVAPLASLYVACAAFRLARFNVYKMKSSHFFQGMPVPGAAFFLISLCLLPASGLYGLFEDNVALLGFNVQTLYTWTILGSLIVMGLLQLSSISFLKVGPYMFHGKTRPVMIMTTCIILVSLIIKHEFTFMAVSGLYVIFNLAANALHMVPAPAPDDELDPDPELLPIE